MERLKTHLAGRLPNDMMNHLICKGGKDQESLLGLIPFRAKFKHVGLRSPWESVSISVLFTLGVKPSCLWEGHSLHWRMSSRIPSRYPPADGHTNEPNTTTSLDKNVSSTLKYSLTHSLTNSTPSTRVHIHVFLLPSCVSLS